MTEENETALERLSMRFPDKSTYYLARKLRKHNWDYEATVAAIRGNSLSRCFASFCDVFSRCLACYWDDPESHENQRNREFPSAESTVEFSQHRLQDRQQARISAVATSVREARGHQATAHGHSKSYKRKAEPTRADYDTAAKHRPVDDKKPEDSEPKLVSKLKHVVVTKCPLFPNNLQTSLSAQEEYHRASYYREKAREYRQRKDQSREIEENNHLAALTYLSENLENKDRINDTIDLHFLHQGEALQALDIFLDKEIRTIQGQNNERKVLSVITGRGLHSPDGLPVLQPLVIARLLERDLQCHEQKGNPGLIKVHVGHDSKLTTDLK